MDVHLIYYVAGIIQVLGDETTPKQQPTLSLLLQEEKLLFAKEIEVMYDTESAELQAYVAKELPAGTYEAKEILNEKY